MTIRYLIFSICSLLFLFACSTEESTDSTEETLDSIVVETDVEVPRSVITLAPELIGTWRLEEQRYGNIPMSIEEIGKSTVEFTQNGTMINSAPGLSPEETTFAFENDVITRDIDGMEHRVAELSATRLVLISEIDNTEIKQIYSRVTL